MPEKAAEDIPVPAEFFAEVLPRSTDLAELKVTLYVIRQAARRYRPMVPLRDLLTPEVLRGSLDSGSPEPTERRLRRVLDRAVANGFLLRLTIRNDQDGEIYFLLASKENRALVARLREGDEAASRRLEVDPEEELVIYRPNVFSFYERHIGPLTPLVAERLRDAERSYPRSWIEEAILTAVHYNKRSWRYIETILTRWEESGAPDVVSGKQA